MSFEGHYQKRSYYRPEIDGLRAIAVIIVMLYHAKLLSVTGGYIGVDIFFVISGYLITQIILREKTTGKFSLIDFYERRARRVLPALFLVLGACLIPALVFFTSAELQAFGTSLAASSLFSANFYFWRSAGGYFALTVDHMPLLHLWSLAIEEQFYLLYPPALLLAWRFTRRWLLSLMIAGFCLSLALCAYAGVTAPVANFFLLPTRAWELLAGSILAIYEVRKGSGRVQPKIIAECASVLGLTLLLVPAFLYDNTTPFPGVYALPPVFGTLLILKFVQDSIFAKKFLVAGPLVATGLISYSAYLWHQPVLAFARTISLNELTGWARAALLLLSLALAWLTWRLVETPFRRRNFLTTRKVWILSALFTFCFLSIGVAMWWTKGFPDRLPLRMQKIAQMNEVYSARINPCFFEPDTKKSLDEACKIGAAGPITLAIIGDSHALTLAPAFEPLLKSRGNRATLLVAAGCAPVLDNHVMNNYQQHCSAFNRRVLDFIIRDASITTVALGARWAYNVERSFFDNQEGGVEIGPKAVWNKPLSVDRLSAAVDEVVDELVQNGKQVVLIYPVPEPGWNVPRYIVQSHMLGIKLEDKFNGSYLRFKDRNRLAYQILNNAPKSPNVIRVYPAIRLCNRRIPNRCVFTTQTGVPLYFDDDHLSSTGARYALPELENSIPDLR